MNKPRLTQAEIEEAKKMIGDGKSISEIANRLGRTVITIKKYLEPKLAA